MDLLEATKKINDMLYESIKNKDSMDAWRGRKRNWQTAYHWTLIRIREASATSGIISRIILES